MRDPEGHYICPPDKWNPKFFATPGAMERIKLFFKGKGYLTKEEYNTTSETLRQLELYKDYYPIDLKREKIMFCQGISFGWVGISVNFRYQKNEKENTIIIINYKDGMSTPRMLARNDLIPIEIPLNIM